MKKLLAIVLTILLSLMLLVACSEDDGSTSSSSEHNPPAESTNTESNKEENEENDSGEVIDADKWYYDQYWTIDAKIHQIDDVGSAFNMPGMYADYIFSIHMIKGLLSEDPSITGKYLLDVDSTIIFNSDEAADRLLSEAMGGLDVSLPGLGVSVEQIAHYSTEPYLDENDNVVYVDSGYMQKVKNSWHSVIKDNGGKIVQPKAGSYMMFEEFTIEYTGSGGNLFYGASDKKTVTEVYLFVIVEPDNAGTGSSLSNRNVKVYITYPEWTINGSEIWLEGEGTLIASETAFPIEGNN